MVLSVVLTLLAAMVLPLTGYVVHDVGQAWAADETSDTSDAVNPRAEYWRAVRQGAEGYTAVRGQETSVLIQNGGENWRAIRNGPLSFYGAALILGALAVLILAHLFTGGSKLESRTGRTIPRWTAFERANHWFVAVLFIILAVTGLSLLFGRTVLIPLLGKEGFAAWAGIPIPESNFWNSHPLASATRWSSTRYSNKPPDHGSCRLSQRISAGIAA